jgi:hypothetical protein
MLEGLALPAPDSGIFYMTEKVITPVMNGYNLTAFTQNSIEVINVANKRRDELISQVKEEYASIASNPVQQQFHLTATNITPEAYYENLQNAVVSEIESGTFDTCRSGTEIVNKVAADKSILSNWTSLS